MADDGVLLEVRERWLSSPRRAAWVWATLLALLVPVLGLRGTSAQALASAAALLALYALRPRLRVRLREHSVEWVGVAGAHSETTRSLVGLGYARLRGADAGYPSAGRLRGSRRNLDFADFESSEELWEQTRVRLLPNLASRILDDLEDGRGLRLWGATLWRGRLEVAGERIEWPDLCEVVDRGDGFLLRFTGRPCDARVVTRHQLPDGPLLAALLERARPLREAVRTGAWGAAGKAFTRPAPAPILGPPDPSLGRCLYTWNGLASRRGPVRLGALGMVAAGVAGIPGLSVLGVLAAAATSLACVVGILSSSGRATGVTAPPFAVHEHGVRTQVACLRWEDCTGVTFEAVDRLRVGPLAALARLLGLAVAPTFERRVVAFSIESPQAALRAVGDDPAFEAAARWMRDAVAPVLATRALTSMQAGGEIPFRRVGVSMSGLRTQRGLLPWSAYAGHRVTRATHESHPGSGWTEVGREFSTRTELRFYARSATAPTFRYPLGEGDGYVLLSLLRALERVGITRRAAAAKVEARLSDPGAVATSDPGSHPRASQAGQRASTPRRVPAVGSTEPGPPPALVRPLASPAPATTRVAEASPTATTTVDEAPAATTRVSAGPPPAKAGPVLHTLVADAAPSPSHTLVADAAPPPSHTLVADGAPPPSHTLVADAPPPSSGQTRVARGGLPRDTAKLTRVDLSADVEAPASPRTSARDTGAMPRVTADQLRQRLAALPPEQRRLVLARAAARRRQRGR